MVGGAVHPLDSINTKRQSQAARFADPLWGCLASSAGDGGDTDPPADRLGLFSCVADTRFFLGALGEALRFASVTVLDVGDDPPSQLRYELGGAGTGLALAGRDSGTDAVLEMGLQVLLWAVRLAAGLHVL